MAEGEVKRGGAWREKDGGGSQGRAGGGACGRGVTFWGASLVGGVFSVLSFLWGGVMGGG